MSDLETSENTENPIDQFREFLLNGDIESAAKWESERRLNREETTPHILDSFNSHKDMRNYTMALQIARHYELDKEIYEHLYTDEWKQLYENGKYEAAAAWAKEQNLGEVEVKRAATMAYTDYLDTDKAEDALRMIEIYELQKDDLLGTTVSEFNKAFLSEDYYKAAMLGKEFNFSAKRTYEAAIKAAIAAMRDKNLDDMDKIIYQFSLINDNILEAVGEEISHLFTESLISDFVKPSFSRGNLHALRKFAEDTNFLEHPFSHDYWKKFKRNFFEEAIKAHNNYIMSGDPKSALYIRDNCKLYTTGASHNLFLTVIESAIKYHNELLMNKKLEDALFIKDKYLLFSKFNLEEHSANALVEAKKYIVHSLEEGEIAPAKRAISEYKIATEHLVESIYKALYNLVSNSQFKETLSLLQDFKLDISDAVFKEKVIGLYKRIIEAKEPVIAAEFARHAKLGKNYIDEAAFKAWESLFLSGKHDKALDIKQNYKLSKKKTQERARFSYLSYMENKNYDMAIFIRHNYNVPLSFGEWLVELIRILFKK